MSLCKNVSLKCARLAVLISLVAAFAVAAQAQVIFSPPKNISNSAGNTNGHQIVVDKNGNVNVIWLDNSPGSYAVFFSRSSDGGVTFSTPVNVSNHPGSGAFGGNIALDSSGNIYIGWGDNSPGHTASFFSRSTDGGATFSEPRLISSAGATATASTIALDSSGDITLGWVDNSPGHPDLFIARSTDQGETFSSPVNVSNDPNGVLGGLFLAVDPQGDIYTLWISVFRPAGPFPSVLFSDSLDGGTTFSTPRVVRGSVISTFPGSVQVAAESPSNINVVWESFTSNDCDVWALGYDRSGDGGATFSQAFSNVTPNYCPGQPAISPTPQMGMDSLGGTNIVWQFSAPGSSDGAVMFSRFVNGSGSSAPILNVQGNRNPAPQLALDSSNNVDIVFVGGSSPGPGILFTQSTDSGGTFSPAQPIPDSSGASSATIVTGAKGGIYVVWQQTDSSGNANVFFSHGIALSLASVSLSTTSVPGGSSSTGMVTLSGPAPTGGAVVSLSSSNPSVASVPASVTVPEGATSATFPVTTSTVGATTNVTISTTLNGVTQNSSLTVRLVYNFSGYLPPLLNNGSSLFHSGRTVPVKFQLTATDGSVVTNATANVQVFQIQNTPTGTVDQDMSATASGNSTSGTAFRFDPTSNQYIYNLSTSGYASGTYLLRTTISDGSTHGVQFSIQ